MSLDHTRDVFEEWGRDDPMYAVLTRKGYADGGWDREAFFRRGREEIAEIMARVDGLGLRPDRRRALDFGCGAGRLTQALAEEFDEVVGLDIAESMVRAARHYNRHGDRVRYQVNTGDRLAGLDDASFDFVYSSKTLQHIPPVHARRYIAELVRVLRPGGVTVFQFRNGPRIEPGTVRSWLYTLRREHLRRFWRRLRAKPPYEMHFVNRGRVTEIIEEGGGRVIDVQDLSQGRPNKSLRIFAEKMA